MAVRGPNGKFLSKAEIARIAAETAPVGIVLNPVAAAYVAPETEYFEVIEPRPEAGLVSQETADNLALENEMLVNELPPVVLDVVPPPVVRDVMTLDTTPVVATTKRTKAPVIDPADEPRAIISLAQAAVNSVEPEGEKTAVVALFHTYRGRPSKRSVIDFLTRTGALQRAEEMNIQVPRVGQQHPRILLRRFTKAQAEAYVNVLKSHNVPCDMVEVA